LEVGFLIDEFGLPNPQLTPSHETMVAIPAGFRPSQEGFALSEALRDFVHLRVLQKAKTLRKALLCWQKIYDKCYLKHYIKFMQRLEINLKQDSYSQKHESVGNYKKK
jgi:hypothetical protein